MLQQLGLPSGIDTAGNDPAAQLQAARLRQVFDRHAAATEIATGRKLTPSEHQEILRQASASIHLLSSPLTRFGSLEAMKQGGPSYVKPEPTEERNLDHVYDGHTRLTADVVSKSTIETEHPAPGTMGSSIQASGLEDRYSQASNGAEPDAGRRETSLEPLAGHSSRFLDTDAARKADILKGGGGNFLVADNPKASSAAPWWERADESQVRHFSKEIDAAAKKTGIDADLIRAIMYMETTHGYYDWLLDKYGGKILGIPKNKSILPMNVNVDYWGDHFGTRDDLHNPYLNILAGAKMLKSIQDNVPPGTSIAKIASLYNSHRSRSVTDYGAHVAQIYRDRLWEK